MRRDRPSATATFIARSLVFWAREPFPHRLVGSHALALALASLRAAGVDERRWWRLCGIPWVRRVIWRCEAWMLPGIVLHYVLRKCAIADAVTRALNDGCQSLVVMAAGFDALGWRTSRDHPHVRVSEVDHPATQAVKAHAVGRTQGLPQFHPLDLDAGSIATLLDRERPTVVVAEGLLMYFAEDQVATILRDIATTVAPGSRVVFTCMTSDRDGRLGFPAGHPLIDRWLVHQREVFRWGIRAEALPAFLAGIGLRVIAHHRADTLGQRFLPPGCRRRSAVGEDIVVAEPLPCEVA
jgi:methyltransferase (TIGR00027 family)